MNNADSGFALIEILVAALLVAVISVGTLAALDGANHTSGNERLRTQSAALAQQEIERMRAMSPSALAAAVGTPTARGVDLGPFHFTVTRTITWESDQSGGAASCTGARPPTYLKIRAAVGAPGLTKPVTADSIVAMPAGSIGGVLTVTVTDDQTPAQPVDSAIVKAGGQSISTNANGCAVFTGLPNGTYTVTAEKVDYIDRNGSSKATAVNQRVFAAQTTGVTLTLGLAGKLDVTFYTNVNGSQVAGQRWDRVKTASGGVTRMFGTPRVNNGTAATTDHLLTTDGDGMLGSAGLWPGSYAIWPGDNCADENFPDTTPITATVTRGQTTTVPVFLRALYPTVTYAGNPALNAHVKFTRRVDCAGSVVFSTPDQLTDGSGHVSLNGVPPGVYDVCARYDVPNVGPRYKTLAKTVSPYSALSPVPAYYSFNVDIKSNGTAAC